MSKLLGLQLLNVANHLSNDSLHPKDLFSQSLPFFDHNIFKNKLLSILESQDLTKNYSNENYFERKFKNWNNFEDWSKRITTERKIDRSLPKEVKRVEYANYEMRPNGKLYDSIGFENSGFDKHVVPISRAQNNRYQPIGFENSGFNKHVLPISRAQNNRYQPNLRLKPPNVLHSSNNSENRKIERTNSARNPKNYLKDYGRNHNRNGYGLEKNLTPQHSRIIPSIPQNNRLNANRYKHQSGFDNPIVYSRFQNNGYGNKIVYPKERNNGHNDREINNFDSSNDSEPSDEENDDEEDDNEENIPEYNYKEDETPLCALDTDHSYCDEDNEYPEERMQHAIDKQTNILTQLMPDSSEVFNLVEDKDKTLNLVEGIDKMRDEKYDYQHYFITDQFPDNSNTTKYIEEDQLNPMYYKEGGYICPSYVSYIQPKRAKNTNGMWKIIVNLRKSYRGIVYRQNIRIEECIYIKGKCSFTADYFNSECIQKSNNHLLLAWTPEKGVHIDLFSLPIACSCHFKGNN